MLHSIKQEFNLYDTLEWSKYTTGIENMMIEMGVTYEFPNNSIVKKKKCREIGKVYIKFR